ncbi:MAG: IMS domain-containing protein [Synechococcus sp.]
MLLVLVDLPIDHFRLLGVSPSANPDAVLRKLQARADAPPDQGFTHDVLRQRDELLRRSADVLVDPASRSDYEATLLELSEAHPGDTVGLDLSPSHEVAGLMLLWEAHAALETFHLVRQALQPPQAPALGSSREADLTLLAALSCRDAAIDEQRQRRYEIAAQVLKEGIELQIRMGKLPDQQQRLQEDLESLTPYRILDLVSRDLAEQEAHQQGLALLDKLVVARGGLEGGLELAGDSISGLSQADFEPFFKQIRRFLTVQEQIDLFGRWFAQGSVEAGCLSVFALTASGFSRRKPERLEEARELLTTLSAPDLDPMPMLGCLDLLLGNVGEASRNFAALRSADLLEWFANFQGDELAAQCEYCRVWLERDVLPGYRDVDAAGVDLDAWFADRDVQAYVDRLDRQALRRAGSDDQEIQPAFALTDLWSPAEAMADPVLETPDQEWGFAPRWAEMAQVWIDRGRDWFSRRSVQATGGVVVVAGFALVLIAPWRSGAPSQPSVEPPAPDLERDASPEPPSPAEPPLRAELRKPVAVTPLTDDQPTVQQLQTMVQSWLDAKARVLAGETADLTDVARDRLRQRVEDERAVDAGAGRHQVVEAMVTSAEPVSAAANRMEIRAQIEYKDRTFDAGGAVVAETAPTAFTIRYVFGRDGQQWKLHEYIADR